MVPGAGAVIVVVEEGVEAAEVFVDGEVRVARPSCPRACVAVRQALLEVLGIPLDLVEEALALAVDPVCWSGGAAEYFEEVLEDVVGGFVGLLGVVGVQDGVIEGAWRVVLWARLGWAGSHVPEELEAVAREGGILGAKVVAGGGGGESFHKEREQQDAVPPWVLWACRHSHGGTRVVLGRSLVGLGGGSGLCGAAVPALCGVSSFRSSLSCCREILSVAFTFGYWFLWSGSKWLGCVWGCWWRSLCDGVFWGGWLRGLEGGCESGGAESSGSAVLQLSFFILSLRPAARALVHPSVKSLFLFNSTFLT